MPFFGKISHLPSHIREELNQRLADGEGFRTLVAWLNALPQVQQTLRAHFGGRPINKVNLTEWKQRAHADWLARRDTLGQLAQLADTSESYSAAANGRLADHLSTIVAARYAATLAAWNGEDTAEFRSTLRSLHQLTRDISLLRRGDHFASRIAINHQWLDLARFKTEEELADYFLQWFFRDDIRACLNDESLDSAQLRARIHKILGVGQPIPREIHENPSDSNALSPAVNPDR